MRISLIAIQILLFLFISVVGFADDDLNWIEFPDPAFQVNGLPWFEENSPDLFRLPKRVQDIVRPPVWNLAQSTSGARIRFKSDCTTLGIRIEYPNLSNMRNMHVFGQSGVDLYVDGVYFNTATHRDEKEVEHIFFQNASPEKREYTLYLPIYNGVKIKEIGLNSNAVLETPRPFALSKPIVFYGTSITQGGCASRSGMSYAAILCRDLNLDFVNLGFSGNGKGEKEIAETIAEIDAACFVLDYMANNKTAESLVEVYDPFLSILREKHPTTPIIAVTLNYVCSENPLGEARSRIRALRDVAREAVAKRIAEGDKNLILVEGYSLLGPDLADGLVDGVHPNDLGFQAMADRLAPTVAHLLSLPLPRTLLR
ncbi:MAG: SGNH/GDSL hydrolase family protein [bacterium]